MNPALRSPRAAWRDLPPGALILALPRPANPSARHVAHFLMAECAAHGGGQTLRLGRAELVLGASPGAARRASEALREVVGAEPRLWRMPQDGAALEHWLAALPAPAPADPALPELAERCRAIPLESLARLTLFAEGPDPRPVAQRLAPVPLAIEDPDRRALAREWLCRRLLAALLDPSQRPRLPALRPGLRLILDLPAAQIPGRPPAGLDGTAPPIALLPLVALAGAQPGARAAALAAAGWEAGHVAEDAGVLALWHPELGRLALPAPAAPPPALLPGMIILGAPVPGWCRAPGWLWELPA